MCRHDSFSDQWPKVGLPSLSAPQPLLEASVVTTFLLCAVSKVTPYFSQKRSLQRTRADTQARVTVMWWRPWCQAEDGTLCFSQNWVGRMWSRPNQSTGKAAAIRPSILWKALSGLLVPSSKEAAWHWIFVARSLSGWGGGSCAMLKPRATGPEWASRWGSWVCRFPSVTEGREPHPCIMSKVRGARDSPYCKTLYWYATPSNVNLKNRLWWGLTGCECTRLSDPATWTSPLGIFARGPVSKWSSWFTFSSGHNSGVWDLE